MRLPLEVWLDRGDRERLEFLERLLEEDLSDDGWELGLAEDLTRSPRPLTAAQREAVDGMRARIEGSREGQRDGNPSLPEREA